MSYSMGSRRDACTGYEQNPQSLRQNNSPSKQTTRVSLLLAGGAFRLKLSRCCLTGGIIHGWCTVQRAAVAPDGVLGSHERDARVVRNREGSAPVASHKSR